MKAILAAALVMLTANFLYAAETSVFELRAVAEASSPTAKPYSLRKRDGTVETLHLEAAALLDHTALKSAVVEKDHQQQPTILVTLKEAGAKRFAEITASRVGERLGVVVAGKLLLAPVVREPIAGGSLQISGNFSEDEAADVATKLNESIRTHAR